MAAKEEGYKSTADADIKIEAISQTHDALQNIMHVISGMAESMNTLGGKIESVAANVSKMDEGLAAQREDIEQLKKTPPRRLRPLRELVRDDDEEMPGLAYSSDSDGEEPLLRHTARRDSYIASHVLTEDVQRRQSGEQEDIRRKSTGGQSHAPVTVLQVQKNVPLHYQSDRVSIPELWGAQECQSIFINENGQEKRLIYFFTPKAHKEFIKSENTLCTSLSRFLTVATIYRMEDDDVVEMAVRLVRNKYTLTRDGFTKTIMGFAPRLQAYSASWKWSIVGYAVNCKRANTRYWGTNLYKVDDVYIQIDFLIIFIKKSCQ